MGELNFYLNVRSPKVIKGVSVEDWFEMIRGSEYSSLIEDARSGNVEYNQVKTSELPCVTYNFLYDSYKKDSNIISSTGLMYIDIDDPSFSAESLEKSLIYAMYRSFGGYGWGIVVKVDGLTKDNFKSSYLKIVRELGISDYVDHGAVKASQYNVLSLDKNIYINPEPHIFKVEDCNNENSPQTCEINAIIHSREESVAYAPDRGEKLKGAYLDGRIPLRFDNLCDIDFEGDYVVNWEGYDWIRCWIPINKQSKGRNSMLLSYCNNLVWLNPHITKSRAVSILSNVNRVAFLNPVSSKQLRSVVDSVFGYLEDGTLKPILDKKKRKIVFKKGSDLSAEDKRDIVLSLCCDKKREVSRQKIYDIIEDWDFCKYGKISSVKIYKNFPVSKKTVEKYWREFKDYVKRLNTDYKKTPPKRVKLML